jgi:hypothetical protein
MLYSVISGLISINKYLKLQLTSVYIRSCVVEHGRHVGRSPNVHIRSDDEGKLPRMINRKRRMSSTSVDIDFGLTCPPRGKDGLAGYQAP